MVDRQARRSAPPQREIETELVNRMVAMTMISVLMMFSLPGFVCLVRRESTGCANADCL